MASGLIANVVHRDFVLAHLEGAERNLAALASPRRAEGLLADLRQRIDAAFHHGIEPEEAELALRAVHLTRQLDEVALAGARAAEGDAERISFISRSPVISVPQSVLEEMIEERLGDRLAPAPEHPAATRVLLRPDGTAPDTEAMGDPFTTLDPRWEIDIAKALVERLVRGGRHPFNPRPAPPVELAGNARLVLFGDWATGLERALDVTTCARQWLLEARNQGREAHAIHLGDVYYAGEKSEYDKRVLTPDTWPVRLDEADAIPSWALNGNHDMYSGGWAFFDHQLADPRFRRQRTPDGKGTSWFELTGPEWHVVGLDSAWNDHPLLHSQWGDLERPQGERVVEIVTAPDARKLLLLSHHQLFSAYDPKGVGPTIERELKPALDSGRVRAWFWGHEHRCMTYEEDHEGVGFGRCAGHAGVPVTTHPPDAPVPAPGTWEYRGQFESHGHAWARFGFVVLDLDGPVIHVSYVDEKGSVDRTEDLV
ncbi:MAG TPA: metallophosphoesterase [Thermoleophilaceae bacterium]|jgi:hypothetical protein